jgi:hypothetical protein
MSAQTKEPDIVERLDYWLKRMVGPVEEPELHELLTLVKAEIERLRAERPGWREAIEAVQSYLFAKDKMAKFMIEVDPVKVGEAEWQAQHRALSRDVRVTTKALRALTPPAPGKGE